MSESDEEAARLAAQAALERLSSAQQRYNSAEIAATVAAAAYNQAKADLDHALAIKQAAMADYSAKQLQLLDLQSAKLLRQQELDTTLPSSPQSTSQLISSPQNTSLQFSPLPLPPMVLSPHRASSLQTVAQPTESQVFPAEPSVATSAVVGNTPSTHSAAMDAVATPTVVADVPATSNTDVDAGSQEVSLDAAQNSLVLPDAPSDPEPVCSANDQHPTRTPVAAEQDSESARLADLNDDIPTFPATDSPLEDLPLNVEEFLSTLQTLGALSSEYLALSTERETLAASTSAPSASAPSASQEPAAPVVETAAPTSSAALPDTADLEGTDVSTFLDATFALQDTATPVDELLQLVEEANSELQRIHEALQANFSEASAHATSAKLMAATATSSPKFPIARILSRTSVPLPQSLTALFRTLVERANGVQETVFEFDLTKLKGPATGRKYLELPFSTLFGEDKEGAEHGSRVEVPRSTSIYFQQVDGSVSLAILSADGAAEFFNSIPTLDLLPTELLQTTPDTSATEKDQTDGAGGEPPVLPVSILDLYREFPLSSSTTLQLGEQVSAIFPQDVAKGYASLFQPPFPRSSVLLDPMSACFPDSGHRFYPTCLPAADARKILFAGQAQEPQALPFPPIPDKNAPAPSGFELILAHRRERKLLDSTHLDFTHLMRSHSSNVESVNPIAQDAQHAFSKFLPALLSPSQPLLLPRLDELDHHSLTSQSSEALMRGFTSLLTEYSLEVDDPTLEDYDSSFLSTHPFLALAASTRLLPSPPFDLDSSSQSLSSQTSLAGDPSPSTLVEPAASETEIVEFSKVLFAEELCFCLRRQMLIFCLMQVESFSVVSGLLLKGSKTTLNLPVAMMAPRDEAAGAPSILKLTPDAVLMTLAQSLNVPVFVRDMDGSDKAEIHAAAQMEVDLAVAAQVLPKTGVPQASWNTSPLPSIPLTLFLRTPHFTPVEQQHLIWAIYQRLCSLLLQDFSASSCAELISLIGSEGFSSGQPSVLLGELPVILPPLSKIDVANAAGNVTWGPLPPLLQFWFKHRKVLRTRFTQCLEHVDAIRAASGSLSQTANDPSLSRAFFLYDQASRHMNTEFKTRLDLRLHQLRLSLLLRTKSSNDVNHRQGILLLTDLLRSPEFGLSHVCAPPDMLGSSISQMETFRQKCIEEMAFTPTTLPAPISQISSAHLSPLVPAATPLSSTQPSLSAAANAIEEEAERIVDRMFAAYEHNSEEGKSPQFWTRDPLILQVVIDIARKLEQSNWIHANRLRENKQVEGFRVEESVAIYQQIRRDSNGLLRSLVPATPAPAQLPRPQQSPDLLSAFKDVHNDAQVVTSAVINAAKNAIKMDTSAAIRSLTPPQSAQEVAHQKEAPAFLLNLAKGCAPGQQAEVIRLTSRFRTQCRDTPFGSLPTEVASFLFTHKAHKLCKVKDKDSILSDEIDRFSRFNFTAHHLKNPHAANTAQSYHHLGEMYIKKGRAQDGEQMLRKALELREALFGRFDELSNHTRDVLGSYYRTAQLVQKEKDLYNGINTEHPVVPRRPLSEARHRTKYDLAGTVLNTVLAVDQSDARPVSPPYFKLIPSNPLDLLDA
eukprot:m.573566 g.573566  ORF g.573566 m.573566 type:complete len:1583 (-) comp57879_c0_seq8:105-4853(-)